MIILASQSPRRKELLGYIYGTFEVRPTHCDETTSAPTPEGQALEVALRKGLAAARLARPEDIVIAADTLVVSHGEVLGKPVNRQDAFRMLAMLSGTTCTVFTGVSVHHGGQAYTLAERSEVTFYPLSEAQIDAYIETGEPFDKAGAFGIQNKGALLIKSIEGDFYNVMGLPVGALGQLLGQLGLMEA